MPESREELRFDARVRQAVGPAESDERGLELRVEVDGVNISWRWR